MNKRKFLLSLGGIGVLSSFVAGNILTSLYPCCLSRKKIKEEFQNGEIVNQDGWFISKSEYKYIINQQCISDIK